MMLFVPLILLFVACANASPWTRLSKKAPYLQNEGLRRDIQSLLRNPEIEKGVEKSLFQSVDVVSETNGCDCVNYNCGCCVHMEVDKIYLNSTVCVNITYLPADYGIFYTLTIGDRTIINDTISARNPPPICVNVPYLKDLASVCLRFHDMSVSHSKLSGCVKVEAYLIEEVLAEKEIGCFTIPPNSQKQGRQPNTVGHWEHQGREPNVKYLTHYNDNVLEKSVDVVAANDRSVRVLQRFHRN